MAKLQRTTFKTSRAAQYVEARAPGGRDRLRTGSPTW
jgi:hypothetical protein